MVFETNQKLTPIMLDRRRHALARRIVWIALGVSTLVIVAGTSIVFQLAREGYSLRAAYAVQDVLLCRLFEWFLGIWIFIVGSCIASFLNVVAYRVPAGLPVTGTSFCPHCRVPIRPSDNVPVWGWLLLGGRCRTCKIRISPRYPIFEFIGGLLGLSIFLSTVLSHGRNLPLEVHSNLSYGMPVNLYFMDDRFFYIAGLHAWLLFFLYAAALTNFGGGRLSVRIWLLGGIGILASIALRPDVFVAQSSDYLVSLSDSVPVRVLQASMLGSIIAIGISMVWRGRFDQTGWTAAWGLVGLTLGWQAALWVGGITAVSLLLKRAVVGRSVADEPIRYLWFFTALFLVIWGQLAEWIGIIFRSG